VHLIKKLFNLKMAKGASVAQHLNELNTIMNQLSSVEINFDDKIHALIVLASLPNSWEAVRMVVSYSAGKSKLSYEDVRDLVLGEEVRKKDASETSSSNATLKKAAEVKRGTLGRAYLNPKRVGANPSLGNNLSGGTMARQATSRRTAKN